MLTSCNCDPTGFITFSNYVKHPSWSVCSYPMLSDGWQDGVPQIKMIQDHSKIWGHWKRLSCPAFFQGSGGKVTWPLYVIHCAVIIKWVKYWIHVMKFTWLRAFISQPFSAESVPSPKLLHRLIRLAELIPAPEHWSAMSTPVASAMQPLQTVPGHDSRVCPPWTIWMVWTWQSWSGGEASELQGSNLCPGSSSLGQRAETGSPCLLLNPKLYALSALKSKMFWFILWYALEFKSLFGLLVCTKKNSWCCPSI